MHDEVFYGQNVIFRSIKGSARRYRGAASPPATDQRTPSPDRISPIGASHAEGEGTSEELQLGWIQGIDERFGANFDAMWIDPPANVSLPFRVHEPVVVGARESLDLPRELRSLCCGHWPDCILS